MTIILEHKSSNNSESTNTCKTNGIVGLKQSPNFLSMRLVQLVNIIKVSSEKWAYLQKVSSRYYLVSYISKILLMSIRHNSACCKPTSKRKRSTYASVSADSLATYGAMWIYYCFLIDWLINWSSNWSMIYLVYPLSRRCAYSAAKMR